MNHWPFILSAYAVSVLLTSALILWAWTTMRRAERQAEQLKQR